MRSNSGPKNSNEQIALIHYFSKSWERARQTSAEPVWRERPS
jgi:hypothetical protein